MMRFSTLLKHPSDWMTGKGADNAVVLYNLGCYYALAGDKELALSWLGRAIRREQRFRALVGNESDFDEFRQDPDFQFVIGELEEDD